MPAREKSFTIVLNGCARQKRPRRLENHLAHEAGHARSGNHAAMRPWRRPARDQQREDWRCAGRLASVHADQDMRFACSRFRYAPKERPVQRAWRRPAAECQGRRECHRSKSSLAMEKSRLNSYVKPGRPISCGRPWGKFNTSQMRDAPAQ